MSLIKAAYHFHLQDNCSSVLLWLKMYLNDIGLVKGVITARVGFSTGHLWWRQTGERTETLCTCTSGVLLSSVWGIYLQSSLCDLVANKTCTHETLTDSFVCPSRLLGMTECSGVAPKAAGRVFTCCRGCRFTWELTTARSPSSARRRTVARSSPQPET